MCNNNSLDVQLEEFSSIQSVHVYTVRFWSDILMWRYHIVNLMSWSVLDIVAKGVDWDEFKQAVNFVIKWE